MDPQLPETRYFDEAAFFLKACKSPETIQYSELVQFSAFVLYLSTNEDGLDAVEFQEWMRVVHNLVQNSDIERPNEYERCLGGLGKLLPHSRQILQYLAEMELEPLGFSRDQVREEILKSKLLLSHPDWREHILDAEAHGYLRGQIGFLFEFSGVSSLAEDQAVEKWKPEVHAQLQHKFNEYFDKAKVTFNEMALRPCLGLPISGKGPCWPLAITSPNWDATARS